MSQSRLAERFAALRSSRKGGLVAYVTAGDPDAGRSSRILDAVACGGADAIEVGVPFSDPLADGPVIQRAAERAIASGANLGSVLDLIGRVRDEIAAPIVIFTYLNPILRLGAADFARRARESGADGALVLDLPVEEADGLRAPLDRHGLDTIFLVSPTTTDDRVRRMGELGRGFLYAISRLGITGARPQLADGAGDLVRRVRRHTSLPIALGFGISRPEQVAEAGRWADAAVVGSGLVNVIAESGSSSDLAGRVESYVRWLKGEPSAVRV